MRCRARSGVVVGIALAIAIGGPGAAASVSGVAADDAVATVVAVRSVEAANSSGPGSIDVSLAWPQMAPYGAVVRIDWTFDGGDVPASIEIQKRINDGSFYPETTKPGWATSIHRVLAFELVRDSKTYNATYQFRVRTVDASGVPGSWVTGPRFDLEKSDTGCAFTDGFATPCVEYSGSWVSGGLAGATNSYTYFSMEPSDSVRVRSSGSELGFVTVTGPDRGIVELTLDGVRLGTIDLYSPTLQPKRPMFIAHHLSGEPKCDGVDACFTNELVIRITGRKNPSSTDTRVDIDDFVQLRILP